jgi:hypothetical protein
MATTTARPLYEIAREIRSNWKKEISGTVLYFGAAPYLSAMFSLDKITDNYGLDSGREIVARFVGQASTWRGPKAKEIKLELNKMLKSR